MQAADSGPARVCVFLLQLGGPRDEAAIEPFLRNLFEDVLPLPSWIRKPLAGIIAHRRAPKVAPSYRQIGGGSPLLANTQAQARALEARLAEVGVDARVIVCMRYAPPRAREALAEARKHCAGMPWVALSLYPHYSFATSRSSLRELTELMTAAEAASLRSVCAYPQDPAYAAAVAAGIDQAVAGAPAPLRDDFDLVFSAHGLPLKLVREGDPYPQHVAATVDAVMARLNVRPRRHLVSYQSKVGPVKWLTPSTIDALQDLGRGGRRHVAVVPIAFTSEHIETLHELDIELKDIAMKAGIETYLRVPTVGAMPLFVDALAQQVVVHLRAPDRCCGAFKQCELGAGAA